MNRTPSHIRTTQQGTSEKKGHKSEQLMPDKRNRRKERNTGRRHKENCRHADPQGRYFAFNEDPPDKCKQQSAPQDSWPKTLPRRTPIRGRCGSGPQFLATAIIPILVHRVLSTDSLVNTDASICCFRPPSSRTSSGISSPNCGATDRPK
jgi:hypothetical protein